MHQLLIYLLKVAVSLAILTCFYKLALQRLTFHTANRIFLLAALLLPFFIPLVNLDFSTPSSPGNEPVLVRWVPATEVVTSRLVPVAAAETTGSGISASVQVLVLWTVVAVVLLARLLFSFIGLARLRRRSSIVSINGIEACSVEKSISPFSFGNKIFLPSGIRGEQGLSEILSHELVHVRQKHTVDILLAEFVCMVQWFNPFAWIIRNAVRQNLEFIADNHVISTGVGRQEYQLLLLSVMGRRSYGMTSQFNLSSLKNRIKMMNKNSNSRTQLLRFVILVPIAAIILLSFRKQRVAPASKLTYKAVIMDIGSRRPVEGVRLSEVVSGKEVLSDKNGIVELVLEGSGKKDLKITYSRNGYISLPSTISLSSTTDEDFTVTELVGIRSGNATDQCSECFTAVFMGDNDVLSNPKAAMEKHFRENNGTASAGSPYKTVGDGGRVAKATASRQKSNFEVSGDSAILREDGKVELYNNVSVQQRSGSEFKGLVVLNGREMPWKEFKAVADSIKGYKTVADGFASVRVLNAEEGKAGYGERGANGVIIIEAKQK